MAPTFRPGKKSRVWANSMRLSRVLDTFEIRRTADAYDVTVLENDDKNFIAGLRGGEVQGSGMFDGSSWHVSEQLAGFLSSAVENWSMAPEGDAIGNLALLWRANQTQINVATPANNRSAITVACHPSSAIKSGKVLLQGTAALTTTGIQTAVDSGVAAGTAAGARWNGHVTDRASGLTSFQLAIQHSSAGSVWAQIDSWTIATTGSTSKVIAGTIKRQLRVQITTLTVSSGAKSVNCLVAIGRSS